jgi:hypothetical protein
MGADRRMQLKQIKTKELGLQVEQQVSGEAV